MDFSHAAWRKSIRSSQNGSCVEVTAVKADSQLPSYVVGVRDSKDPGGPVLMLGPGQWQAFTSRVKAGMFNLA
ncbi:MAG TPA: DUF397 domain-containing protein [Streptosporangiaceae bacterium]|jgi:hypothetical protein